MEIDTDRSIISSFAIVGKGKGRKRSITGHLPGAYAMAALEYQCAASESLDEREREREERKITRMRDGEEKRRSCASYTLV